MWLVWPFTFTYWATFHFNVKIAIASTAWINIWKRKQKWNVKVFQHDDHSGNSWRIFFGTIFRTFIDHIQFLVKEKLFSPSMLSINGNFAECYHFKLVETLLHRLLRLLRCRLLRIITIWFEAPCFTLSFNFFSPFYLFT